MLKKSIKIYLMIVMCIAMASLVFAEYSEGVNLLSNPGFEDVNSISPWVAEGASCTIAINTTDSWVGDQSARVNFPAADGRGIRQNLTLDPNDRLQEYSISCYVNADDHTELTGYKLGLWENSSENGWTFHESGWKWVIPFTADNSDWVGFTYTVTLTDSAATTLRAVVKVAPQGTPKVAGHFLVDDVVVMKVKETHENLVSFPVAGAFYSTLYGKEVGCDRLEGVGIGASHFFLKDVDDDGKDDAVIYYNSGALLGQWFVALSDGNDFGSETLWLDDTDATTAGEPLMGDVDGNGSQDAVLFVESTGVWTVALSDGVDGFDSPVQFSSGNGVGSDLRFITDMDGDGKDDAVIAWKDWQSGVWYVGLSNGTNSFGGFSAWITGFGVGSDERIMGDVDGDGDTDALLFFKSSGNWEVALSTGSALSDDGVWKTGFGDGDALKVFARDMNLDGNADIVYYMENAWWGEWFTAFSNGSSAFTTEHRAIADWRNIGTKGNPYTPDAWFLGNMKGGSTVAGCIVANGTWYCLEFNSSVTVNGSYADTWSAWDNDYIPQIPGLEGTYDSGDPVINDAQIEMLHDAGFTYIMFDVTNGTSAWVDNRVRKFLGGIRYWNDNLGTGDHKMYACINLGATRGISGEDNFFNALDDECERAWDEFIAPYCDVYYYLEGKPLVVHMITTGLTYYENYDTWSGGSRTYMDKVTSRWSHGWAEGATDFPNFYGWLVPDKFANPIHQEMMPVQPGFWNGSTYVDREDGDFYRSHWMRVIDNEPNSVFVVSYNENWEHNSIEPAYMFNTDHPDRTGIEAWADSYGDRMDDYYWVMTEQYMKLYIDGDLYDGTYLQEYISPGNYGSVYRADPDGFVLQGSDPHQAPILLLPSGFRAGFTGDVIVENDPPTPNPATFASAPSADSSSAISMTATTGTDKTGPVEYYFDETTGGNGATDSGWQTSPSYTDSDLDAETMYTYTVQMRDSSATPNTGTASSGSSATTGVAGINYTEKYQSFTASAADSWVDADLSGYGVTDGDILEIGIRNSRSGNERWAGVRANGSSIDRRVQLHEAEGGGWDVTTMHVVADVDGKIEVYADNTSQNVFYLLSIWDDGAYTEKYTSFTANSTGSFVDEDLSGLGVGANQMVEIQIRNNSSTTEYYGGVRANGSSNDRRVDIHEAESGGDDVCVMLAQADGSGIIEVYAENSNIDYVLLGYWTTAPGTYTEKFVSVGKPASDNTWLDLDLTADGVPDGAVAEIGMFNGQTGSENIMGVRTNGSSLSRTFDLQESESNGRDCGRMHVVTDSGAVIEQFMEDVSDTAEFYLLGYWE